jgi:hypothetical protein
MHRFELTDKEPFFSIKDKLHLSYQSPGPVDLDLSIFTELEKNWLAKAKLTGVLKIDNLNPGQVPVEIKTSISVKPTNISPVDKRKELVSLVSKQLQGPINSIYQLISDSTDITYLRLMKEEEASNKNRTKLLATIDKKLLLLSSQVTSLIGEPLTQQNIQKEPNLPLVEESLEDTVQITLG